MVWLDTNKIGLVNFEICLKLYWASIRGNGLQMQYYLTTKSQHILKIYAYQVLADNFPEPTFKKNHSLLRFSKNSPKIFVKIDENF